MYQPSPSSQRSPNVEEGDWRQGNNNMATDRRQSSYPSHSPTFAHFHAPFTAANASYERGSYPSLHHPPTPAPLPLSSAAAAQQSPVARQTHMPPSNGFPSVNGSSFQPPEKPSSTFYDPTLDYREASPNWTRSDYSRQSSARRQSNVSESTISSCHSKSRTL